MAKPVFLCANMSNKLLLSLSVIFSLDTVMTQLMKTKNGFSYVSQLS